jgi:hypothetical protein
VSWPDCPGAPLFWPCRPSAGMRQEALGSRFRAGQDRSGDTNALRPGRLRGTGYETGMGRSAISRCTRRLTARILSHKRALTPEKNRGAAIGQRLTCAADSPPSRGGLCSRGRGANCDVRMGPSHLSIEDEAPELQFAMLGSKLQLSPISR